MSENVYYITEAGLKYFYELAERQREATCKRMEGDEAPDAAHLMVNDHRLTMLDAKLSRLKRTIAYFENPHLSPASVYHAHIGQDQRS